MSETQFSLGKILSGSPQRDAVHVAVAPVIAAVPMKAGQHIGLIAGTTDHVGLTDTPIGIVDPFLSVPVQKGDRFWMWLYPNTITSLHHLWTHPAFAAAEPSPISESEKWIRDWVQTLPISYDVVMNGADDWVRSNGPDVRSYDYLVLGGLLEGERVPDEFWPHYENVRGVKLSEEVKSNFFSCSC